MSANDDIADISRNTKISRMRNPSRYAGMTVNERLFEARLLEAFDAAARARDRSEMIRILTEVDVDDAAGSADAILQRPEKYGF